MLSHNYLDKIFRIDINCNDTIDMNADKICESCNRRK